MTIPESTIRNFDPAGVTCSHHFSKLWIFFYGELNRIYGAEKHRIIILNRIMYFAYSRDLKRKTRENLGKAEQRLWLLHKVFVKMASLPFPVSSKGMNTLSRKIERLQDGPLCPSKTTDAQLLLWMGNIDHYLLAAYRGLCRMAAALRLDEVTHTLKTFTDLENPLETLSKA